MTHNRPWRFFVVRRYDRRPWPFTGKRRYRRRRPRKRFTLKQRPLLRLFLLNAPWRRSRYRLKGTNARLSSHFQAFCMCYGIKEKPSLRLIRNVKRQPGRVRVLFEKFERRLDVMLVRLGWSFCFKSARKLLVSAEIGISKRAKSKPSVVTDETYCLSFGDRLCALSKQGIYNYITNRFKTVV